MSSRTETSPAAWYLGATPTAVSRWLVWLRWTTAGIDAVVVLAAVVLPAGTFPLRQLMPLIAASALAHVELAREGSLNARVARTVGGASLAIGVVLLTGLLELSGGPSNAFSVVYVVLVTLAAVTLGGAWASAIGLWAALCYGVLISWHMEELVPAHHR